jgi:hypothetical protein
MKKTILPISIFVIVVLLTGFLISHLVAQQQARESDRIQDTLNLYVETEPIDNGAIIFLKYPGNEERIIVPSTGIGEVGGTCGSYFREEDDGRVGIYLPGIRGKRFAAITKEEFQKYSLYPFVFAQNAVLRGKELSKTSNLIDDIVAIPHESEEVKGTLLIVVPKGDTPLFANSVGGIGEGNVLKRVILKIGNREQEYSR